MLYFSSGVCFLHDNYFIVRICLVMLFSKDLNTLFGDNGTCNVCIMTIAFVTHNHWVFYTTKEKGGKEFLPPMFCCIPWVREMHCGWATKYSSWAFEKFAKNWLHVYLPAVNWNVMHLHRKHKHYLCPPADAPSFNQCPPPSRLPQPLLFSLCPGRATPTLTTPITAR